MHDRPQLTYATRFPATETAVRERLGDLRRWLALGGAPEAACGAVEIALAEVLNNVVEHAYATVTPPDPKAAVHLLAARDGARLDVHVCDFGASLPGLNLPEGQLPANDVARDNLPEGGFGWFLIRELSERLCYSQFDRENRLDIRFDLEALSN